jgi:acyl carrier protein
VDKLKFFEELEIILELDSGSITGEEQLSDLGGWDSLAILSFISMVDEKMGMTLEPKRIAKCLTPMDLCQLCGDGVVG